MATSEQYAAWIVKNKDLKGTPEFEKVAKAYELSKQSQPSVSEVQQNIPSPEGERLANLPPANKFLMGAGNAVINPVLGLGQLTGLVPDQYIQERQARFAPLEKESTAYGAGKLGGEVALGAMIPGGATLRGATLGQAALGAAQPAQNLEERGINAAIGGVGAGVGYGATKALGRVLSPQTSEYAKTLINEGITPTPGQILGGAWQRSENKLESIPLLGDMIKYGHKQGYEEFNKAALNRALSPIGEETDQIGRAGIADVRKKLNAYYDNLLPNLSFKPDAEFKSEISNIKQLVSGLPKSEQNAYSRILKRVEGQASPNGGMVGETFKEVESILTNEIKKFKGSADAYQKSLGDALEETLKTYRGVLPRANPNYKQELNKANEGWANYSRVREASKSTATGANEGVFPPSQLAGAVLRQDKSAGKTASSEGRALMQDLAEAGTNVLSSKYPDSGTTGRALLDMAALQSGFYNPAIPAGLIASGLPFVGPGRKVSAAILTQRPQASRNLGDLLSRNAVMGSRVAAPSLLDLYQQQ